MENSADRLKESMRRHIAKQGPKSAADLQIVLDGIVQLLEGRIASKFAMSPAAQESAKRALWRARQEIASEFMGRGEDAESGNPPSVEDALQRDMAEDRPDISQRSALVSWLISGLVGLLLGAVGSFLTLQTSGQIVGRGQLIPEADKVSALEAAVEIQKLVNRLEAELTRAESSIDLPSPDKFYSILTFWREQYLSLSPEARYNFSISVRKDGDAYKILVGSPSCSVATAEGIFRQDPKRPSPFGEICALMAVWSDGAQDF